MGRSKRTGRGSQRGKRRGAGASVASSAQQETEKPDDAEVPNGDDEGVNAQDINGDENDGESRKSSRKKRKAKRRRSARSSLAAEQEDSTTSRPRKHPRLSIRLRDSSRTAQATVDDGQPSTARCKASRTVQTASAETTEPLRREFNIFRGLLKENDLLLQVTTYLPIRDIINLYCVSKHFHWLINSTLTTYIVRLARIHAPDAEDLFPFTLYRHLCIRDPIRRPMISNPTELRFVPSFRWLQMVTYRRHISTAILLLLRAETLNLGPDLRGSATTLQKLWLTMDMPTNAQRLAIFRDARYWTDADLFRAQMFVIKLDMRCSDPIDGHGEIATRRLLLGQRTLTALYAALRGDALNTRLHAMQMFARYIYTPRTDEMMGKYVLGIPPYALGATSREGWGYSARRLIRPDELVIRESIRRRMKLQNYFVDCMIFGFIDPETLEDVETPTREEVEEQIKEMEDRIGLTVRIRYTSGEVTGRFAL